MVRSTPKSRIRDAALAPVLQPLSHDPRQSLESAEARAAFGSLLIQAQEEDRRRISEELHDNLCQKVALLSMAAGRLESAQQPEPLQDLVRGLRGGLEDLAETVRSISHRLHPSTPERLGLESSLRYCCAEFEQHAGIRVRFLSRQVTREVPGAIALCLYRVLQEALMNVWKHAKTPHCAVIVQNTAKFVRLAICDRGAGFAPARDPRRGLGLVTMKERVRLLGGELTISSVPQKGTQIDVRIPLE